MKKTVETITVRQCRAKRRYFTAVLTLALCAAMTCPAFVLGWGIVQVGMSIQSHDASQRTQGFLCLFGGLMIAFAQEILTSIGAM